MTDIDKGQVAFFDTHALHFLQLYLGRAREASLYPFTDGQSEFDGAKESVEQTADESLRRGLTKGLRTVHWLLRRQIHVQYSPASELELMMGRARGKAIVSAAQEGHIPDRMWTRVHDRAIATRLADGDLESIKMDVDGLASTMQDAGIEATRLGEQKTPEVMELAKGIGGLVYLGSLDMMIFASALVAGADLLITEDDFLKRTINRANTGDPALREKLRLLVSQVTLVDDSAVVLPAARRMP